MEDPSTAALLTAYLVTHLGRLEEQDRRLRGGDDPEAVHQLRVAARRLRSALATYSPVLVPDAASGLRAELRWVGGALAGARDAQVLGGRLARLVAEQPADLVTGPVRSRIDRDVAARIAAGLAGADAALGSERYRSLRACLDTFVDRPPIAGDAGRPAREVVPGLLERDLERLRRRQRAYDAARDPEQRDTGLHEVRKAAKRVRYAAESARPVLGEPAERLVSRAEALQELLGEHQDTVVSRAALQEIGAGASRAGEDTATLGRLHAVEQARAAELERDVPERLARVLDRGPGRTLRGRGR